MASTAKTLGASVADYLDGELHSEVKHEYINGEVYAMVGATADHNTIAGNCFAWLHSRVKPPCKVFMGEVKARVHTGTDDRFYYPDVMIACDQGDLDPYYRKEPCLIIEVLSDSTERRDRADKFFAYRKLPSLREYVLIAQDSYRVEVYRKSTQWDLEIYGGGQRLRLDCAADELAVAEVYRGAEPAPLAETPL
jgi:Uma2 family endonuclease